jgi:dihydroxyacid dehydratase/phosphogluconate dehydratase
MDPRKLRSQRLRSVNYQGDALRLGMNWTEEDLAKPQVLVDSAYGMGHPGTFHFRPLIEEASNGVFEAGGKPGVFTISDICDGVAQAHEGMSYSLVSRDIMAAMVEIHALGHPHDGMVLISGNDKSVPAHLLAIARCNLPAIHVPGGTQLNTTTALVTDGRFSGAMKGPCIGHVTPEALDGGPLALVEERDLVEVHVPECRLAIVGVGDQPLPADQVERVLAGRRARWAPPPPRHTSGILSLYGRVARGSSEGASMT